MCDTVHPYTARPAPRPSAPAARLTRRAVLVGSVGLPGLARAWLAPASVHLDAAAARFAGGERRRFGVRSLARSGERSAAVWSFDPAHAPRLPCPFEREMLHALFCQGVAALAGHLAISTKERRMALVNGRPSQIIGRPERSALWIDHRDHVVLRIARGDEQLHLVDWDRTADRPWPLRLEYHRAGRWVRVTALARVA